MTGGQRQQAGDPVPPDFMKKELSL
ncbi:hypothetical protein DFA_11556 [Cavenderia fasciculata]|uniref:Uncharacterized protein n=1 Tax=Cavenderia fasciculata TaxID=261658 RepID=F4QDJ8_CACFS|nr:hypothetical protein DFA_11556 [Cavenderia fasciculata]EGG13795.1 hypothetical protein DFA_11556 [Cavenderia fasciculata]|eukprot:XP_004350503.1 hypothetical protein DFA_11556 [Cavenderia fasciculata]